jgi:hypothetical protein
VNERVGRWRLMEYRPGTYKKGPTKWVRDKHPAWKCECECGTIRWVKSCNLQNGQSTSCGCRNNSGVVKYAHLDLKPVNSVWALADTH